MKKNNQNKGITLIALIITVIVLLILAGTAVSMALNEGNLFDKANEAKTSWNRKVEEENGINDTLAYIEQYIDGEGGGGAGTPTPTATPVPLPTGWSQTAVASAYPSATATQKAPIPKGFKASIYDGETAIAGGLVIYKTTTDLVADTGSSTTNHDYAMEHYDQYVWIPVDNSSTITWSYETENTTLLDDGTGTYVDETKEATLTLTADFNAMKTSVQTYGGFYISRYELGGTVSSPTSVKGQTVLTAEASSANQWYGLYNAAHQDITDGTNTVLKGHMIFNSEYEKVLAFIDSNNASYSTTVHQNKQQTVKHASGIIAEGQTGKELDIVNNIIDLEGNVWEWTAQADSTSNRVKRGGSYSSADYGIFFPASNSLNGRPTGTVDCDGTRQALYVTL